MSACKYNVNSGDHCSGCEGELRVEIGRLEATVEVLSKWHYPFDVREAVRRKDIEALKRIGVRSDEFLKGLQDTATAATTERDQLREQLATIAKLITAPLTTEDVALLEVGACRRAHDAARQAVVDEMEAAGREGRLQLNSQCASWPAYQKALSALNDARDRAKL